MEQIPFRIGQGQDVHRLVAGRPLILGGVAIPFDRGLDGHSDADIVIHAVIDALLGAAGLGDIGERFPNTDTQWAGADSTNLLATVVDDLVRRGWVVVNLDCTIEAERPKLTDWKPVIRDKLAELLRVDRSVVNVKAKTSEKTGPVGRGESMAAHAAVLICRTPSNSQQEDCETELWHCAFTTH